MPSLPMPVRAAIGLAAAVVDEAKTLPDKAIELPMLAVSQALQLSLRAQQQYAALAARGEEILATRHVSDEPPAWATFDEPIADATGAAAGDVIDDRAQDAGDEPATVQPLADHKASRARPRKTVRAPRNGAPSPFDAVGDEP
jgi:hypothetical protein